MWDAIHKYKLNAMEIKKIIRSSMFLTDKYKSDGTFDKWKARLVAGGNRQSDTELLKIYDTLSSPTVSQDTVMLVLGVAAIEKREIASVDIDGAYLECELPEGDVVIMEANKEITKLLVEVDGSVEEFVDKTTGKCYLRLNKALYGCIQSSMLWYDKLRGALESGGFVVNPYDSCLFNNNANGTQVTVCFHVDDLLVTSKSKSLVDKTVDFLKTKFRAITVVRGKKHSYLALNIEIKEIGIVIDMIGYELKVLKDHKSDSRVNSPGNDDLFDEMEDLERLSSAKAEEFHSKTAQLIFLAKRVRLDILTAVSHMASRVTKSTKDDEKKLNRILSYLSNNPGEALILKWGGKVEMKAYIDASYGTHQDGMSRSGIVIEFAGAGILGWSSRQKAQVKSACEAEIMALSDGLSHVLWVRHVLQSQGYYLPPTVVYQDNKGVIDLMGHKQPPRHRTKHMKIRDFWAREQQEMGEVILQYIPTADMIADLMTKPVTGQLFTKLVNRMFGKQDA